jgi:xanthine dehydrogenase YagT iron-sulfur-binding subunit
MNDAFDSEKPERSQTDTSDAARDVGPDQPSTIAVSGDSSLSPAGLARRRFLCRSGAVTTGAAALHCMPAAVARPAPHPQSARAGNALPAGPGGEAEVAVDLVVNGHTYRLQIEPRVTLLDALRERVGLTGTKKGCDRGQCGACTVLVNGRRINSCLTLAVMHDGDLITTIEGIAPAGELGLHPVQRAFVEHDGFQCGFCTPGQICSAVAMLDEVAAGTASAATVDVRAAAPVALTDAEIRERMSGNLCRCGAYVGIVDAIRDASSRTT